MQLDHSTLLYQSVSINFLFCESHMVQMQTLTMNAHPYEQVCAHTPPISAFERPVPTDLEIYKIITDTSLLETGTLTLTERIINHKIICQI
jgi:hypothetical protein